MVCALVKVLQRNQSNELGIYREEVYFKKLPHLVVEASKSKMFRASPLVGEPGRVDVAVQSPKIQNSFCLGGNLNFLLKPSIDWLRPTQIVESYLLSSKSTDINRHMHWPVDISLTSFLNMFLLLLHSSPISCLITSNILRLLPTQVPSFFFSLSGVICPTKGTSLLPHFVQLSAQVS